MTETEYQETDDVYNRDVLKPAICNLEREAG